MSGEYRIDRRPDFAFRAYVEGLWAATERERANARGRRPADRPCPRLCAMSPVALAEWQNTATRVLPYLSFTERAHVVSLLQEATAYWGSAA